MKLPPATNLTSKVARHEFIQMPTKCTEEGGQGLLAIMLISRTRSITVLPLYDTPVTSTLTFSIKPGSANDLIKLVGDLIKPANNLVPRNA